MKYTMLSGSLPQGTRVVNDRGVMKIGGTIPLGTLFNPPTMVENGRLATLDPLDTPSIDLQVTAHAGKNIVATDVINGYLPFGLFLVEGGIITGEVEENMERDPFSFLPEDAPVWVTREGRLGSANELQTATFYLNADGATNYTIQKGYLPFGFRLEGNAITGTAAELFVGGQQDATYLAPVWTTPRGLLANLGEGVTYSNTLTAVSSVTDAPEIEYMIIKGSLPAGLILNGATGAIEGVTKDISVPNDAAEFVHAAPSLQPVAATAAKGQAFERTLSYTVASSVEFDSIRVVSGALPAGLLLIGNTITGTPTLAGSYSFSLVAMDSATSKSNIINCNIEVTE